MAGYLLSTASGILKEVVLPKAREQLNNKTDAFNMFEKRDEVVEGLEAVLSLHVGRTSGIGARLEDEASPASGKQSFVKVRVPMRKHVGRIELSIEAMKAIRSDKSGVELPMITETKRIVNDLRRDLNREVFGLSNGAIATCGVTSAASVVVLAAATTLTQMRQFEVGMHIDGGTMASPTFRFADRTITAVDRVNKTLTISGAVVTTAGTDFIFRQGNGGDITNSSQREITGLSTQISSTTTLFTLAPATQPVWASTYDTSGADRNPTELVLQQPMDNVAIESGEEIDIILTEFGVYRKFGSNLTSQKRFNSLLDLKGGAKGLDVTSGGKTATLYRDRDCPEKTAFGLNLDHINTATYGSGAEWMDDDGAVLTRVSGKTNYEATLVWFIELFVDDRAAHFVQDKLLNA